MKSETLIIHCHRGSAPAGKASFLLLALISRCFVVAFAVIISTVGDETVYVQALYPRGCAVIVHK